MNNTDPNTQTNMGNDLDNTNFSDNPQDGSHTNPFTGDLKGEFTSDFGTNTNAVSQIFKSNGLGGENRTKLFIAGAVVIALLGVGFFFYTMDDTQDSFDQDLAPIEAEMGEEEEAVGEEGEEGVAGEEGEEGGAEEIAEGEGGEATEATTEAEGEATQADEGLEAAAPEAAQGLAGMGAISIVAPHNHASLAYDETKGPATFQWEGNADRIVFARTPSMVPAQRIINVAGHSSFSFDHPYPGTWYWRLENAESPSEVRQFVINAPVRRVFPVKEPQSGGSISGDGGVVSWQADKLVARYQVQLVQSGGSWANPQYRFGTSGTSIALQNVSPGVYDMKVGAFSEVSGRWEWQLVTQVNVQ